MRVREGVRERAQGRVQEGVQDRAREGVQERVRGSARESTGESVGKSTREDARRGAGETMYNEERILENGEWIVYAGECILRNVDRRSTYWIIIMEEAYYCREGRMGNV